MNIIIGALIIVVFVVLFILIGKDEEEIYQDKHYLFRREE